MRLNSFISGVGLTLEPNSSNVRMVCSPVYSGSVPSPRMARESLWAKTRLRAFTFIGYPH